MNTIAPTPMQSEDERDTKQMMMLERRIRALAVQKKVSPRAYFCTLVSILCDFAIKMGVPLDAVNETIEENYIRIEAEYQLLSEKAPTKH